MTTFHTRPSPFVVVVALLSCRAMLAAVPQGAEHREPPRAITEATAPPIVGRVVDEKGAPVGGAEVRAIATSQDTEAPPRLAYLEGVTDADGRFRLAPPDLGGATHIVVRARGHQQRLRTLDRLGANGTDLGSLVLQPGAIVTGRVVDARSRPVAGATVASYEGIDKAEAASRRSWTRHWPAYEYLECAVKTDADGRFELAHVVPGAVSIEAWSVDHPVTHVGPFDLAAGATRADLALTLDEGATIHGTITGLPADADRSALRVFVDVVAAEAPDGSDPPRTVSDQDAAREGDVRADGSFSLRGLEAGQSCRLWIMRPRGDGRFERTSERVEALAGAKEVQLRYDLGVVVTGTVVDATTGAPVEGLRLQYELRSGRPAILGGMVFGGAAASGRSGDALRIECLWPEPGDRLCFSIEAPGYSLLVRDRVDLPRRGVVDLGRIDLQRVPRCQVRVLDLMTRQPIAGATVVVRAAPLRVGPSLPGETEGLRQGLTDAAGRCQVNALVGTDLTVTASVEGYAPNHLDVADPAKGGVLPDEILLCVGGSIEAVVLDSAGRPVDGQVVDLMSDGFERDISRRTQHGIVRFEHVAPGARRVRVADTTRRDVLSRFSNPEPITLVTVVDGETLRVELKAIPVATLHGVVREGDHPLADAEIERVLPASPSAALLGGGGGESVHCGADGAYRIENLRPGSQTLRITQRDRAMPTTVEVEVKDGDNAFDIDLDMTVLRGVVVDDAGQPIGGARLIPRRAADAVDDEQLVTDEMLGMVDRGRASGIRITTGADGRFELRGVAADVDVQVRVIAIGHEAALAGPFRVARGGVREGVEVRLLRAGSVLIRFAARVDMAMATAHYRGDAQGVQPVRLRFGGVMCPIPGLRPGTWEVVVEYEDGTPTKSRKVEVRAGAETKVEF